MKLRLGAKLRATGMYIEVHEDCEQRRQQRRNFNHEGYIGFHLTPVGSSLPKHVAIIMDGNGRWAGQRGKPRIFGHRAGLQAARAIVAECVNLKIPALTLFAFSSENWKRPAREVEQLMHLFRGSFKRNLRAFHEQQIELKFIGDISRFDSRLRQSISEIEKLTGGDQGLKLRIAANYGGQWDILQATHKIISLADQGILKSDSLTTEKFTSFLSLSDLPKPDLFIRTGGEKRLSNFLLWQLAYTELFFLDILWPDFTPEEFHKILLAFSMRERRFGLTSEQVEKSVSA